LHRLVSQRPEKEEGERERMELIFAENSVKKE
jgi:hypothetical protein